MNLDSYIKKDCLKKNKNWLEAKKWLYQAIQSGHVDAHFHLAEICELGGDDVRNFGEAVKCYRTAAENNQAEAQFRLGYAYKEGLLDINKNWLEAKKWLYPAAQNGHINAQFHLAEICELGGDDVRNFEEAVKWYGTAAEKNHTEISQWCRSAAENSRQEAQFRLGHAYKEGLLAVNKNWLEAKKWLYQAAQSGHVDAQVHLAEICEIGGDDVRNFEEAVKWYRQPAEKGDVAAQYNLGMMYYEGRGTAQSYIEAANLMRRAAQQQLHPAQFWLGFMYENGHGVELSYNEAIRFYRLAAEGDQVEAQFRLGYAYKEGSMGLNKNWLEAKKWLYKAAERGHSQAQFYLAKICECGGDDVRDFEEAIRWYRSSSNTVDVAAYNLGMMYYEGRGVAQSYFHALSFFGFAAEKGYSMAQAILGVMYGKGQGVPQSNVEAVRFYRLAADKGDEIAQYNLGWMYENGQGVEKSNCDAIYWYKRAANGGFAQAQSQLAALEEILDEGRVRSENDWYATGLSIDGGGIRGIIPAIMMTRLEQATGYPIHKLFDTIAGTSIGGILALGVAGTVDGTHPIINPPQLIELFKLRGKDIFSSSLIKKVTTLNGYIEAKYNPQGLEKVLFDFFGNSRLSQTLTHVTVTGVIPGLNKAITFDSFAARCDSTFDFFLRDVGRATSAAPTYFPAATISNIPRTETYTIIDGGVGQNNPVRLVDDHLRIFYPNNRSDILSFGTGESDTPHYLPPQKGGKLHWIKDGAIINALMGSSADFNNYGMGYLFSANILNFNRLQPQFTYLPELDDVSYTDIYERAAAQAFDEWEGSEYMRWLKENTDRKHPNSLAN